jgi:hypothetical protein
MKEGEVYAETAKYGIGFGGFGYFFIRMRGIFRESR